MISFNLSITVAIYVAVGLYLYYKYRSSRRKDLFIKRGYIRSYLIVSLIVFIIGFLISLILPESPLNLRGFQLHSETISAKSRESLFYHILSIFSEVNLIGAFFALLILLIWIYYLRKLDFFNQEKVSVSFLALFLGMLCTFLVFPISNFLQSLFNISFGDNVLYNLFIYSWLKIGLVEELVKIIPVLIVLRFTKEVDEPIDLVYYACLSALGFAFIENLLYFRQIGGQLFIGRAMYSTIGHMIDASFCVYGIILSKFKYKKVKLDLILIYFLLGSFIHAMYDFFLFQNWIILFYISFLIFIQSWAIIINNCINNSKYFSYRILPQYEKLKVFMAISFSLLLILSFIADGLIVGQVHAVNTYWNSVFRFSVLIAFYVTGISSFDMVKGYWRKVDFSLRDDYHTNINLRSFFRIFTNNSINPQNRVGKKIQLHSPKSNVILASAFNKADGKIINRIKLKRLNKRFEYNWFKVKLDRSIALPSSYVADELYIQFDSPFSSLDHDTNIICHLRAIKRSQDDPDKYQVVDFGQVIVNGHDYSYG